MVAAISVSSKNQANTLKSYLKYPGGKRNDIHLLSRMWHDNRHRRLVDLTTGSCSIALGLNPQSALLNDVNPHVINLHQWVKRGLKVTLEMVYDETIYYQYRDQFNQLVREGQGDTALAAQLFYYLNRTCYNGVIRFSELSGFNTSFGKYTTVNYLKSFAPWKKAFQHWKFNCADFSEVKLRVTDFVIADPPYDSIPKREQLVIPTLEPLTQPPRGSGFIGYNAEDFNWFKQKQLAEFLAQHRGPVVLFNHATERIVDLYQSLDFNIHYYQGRRSVACNGDRKPSQDLIATRNLQ